MSTSEPVVSNSKFTRGEKCIFAHLVATFLAIVVLVVVYFAHLCLVPHSGDDIYKITRRSNVGTADPHGMNECVGAVQVQGERVCGAVWVRARWAAAPAQCVAARARPDLAPLLPHWRLLCAAGESEILRGVIHPQFELDELVYNVGLFQHSRPLLPVCTLPSQAVAADNLLMVPGIVIIVGWQKDKEGAKVSMARVLGRADCDQLVSAVVGGPRPPETCLVPSVTSDDQPLLGSAVFMGSHLVGLSSWGEPRATGFPLVVLHLAPYRQWLETTMNITTEHRRNNY